MNLCRFANFQKQGPQFLGRIMLEIRFLGHIQKNSRTPALTLLLIKGQLVIFYNFELYFRKWLRTPFYCAIY